MSNLFAFRKLMITWLSESSLFCGAVVLIFCSASSLCLLLNIFTHVEGVEQSTPRTDVLPNFVFRGAHELRCENPKLHNEALVGDLPEVYHFRSQ